MFSGQTGQDLEKAILTFHGQIRAIQSIARPEGARGRKSDPDWTRTNDLLLRRQLLYPAELPDQFLQKYKKPSDGWPLFSRGGQIRTDDLLLPKQARYRATLHPEILVKGFEERTTFPGRGTYVPRGVIGNHCQHKEQEPVRTDTAAAKLIQASTGGTQLSFYALRFVDLR